MDLLVGTTKGRSKMAEKEDRTEFTLPFLISTRLLEELELTPRNIRDELNEMFREFLVNRVNQMELLKKCKEGGLLHTINTLTTTAEWMISNMMKKDRDATDFVLKQYVDSIQLLLLDTIEPSEHSQVIERLTAQMLGLNEICQSDESYFSNVRAIIEVINEESMELISSEYGLEEGT